ncbi:hypothetical protein [Streptomyces sp. 11x1]|uniref:hypothetical protein n=1 Tax=Streptomyces sp. 11x1 TaxID=3038642 RepID=UPI00292E60FB|nr:hypothetical protein [Streptomyces sp. 11x1]WNZ13877.1 hypothetical protein P8T65_44205 [Streptomyces sp. 11x1]
MRARPEFVDAAHMPAGERLSHWLGEAPRPCLLVLETGAAFNTPGVIRWPMENVVRHTPGARLVRVNPTIPRSPPTWGTGPWPYRLVADLLLDALAG